MRVIFLVLFITTAVLARINPFYLPEELQNTSLRAQEERYSSSLQSSQSSLSSEAKSVVASSLTAASISSTQSSEPLQTIDYGFVKIAFYKTKIAIATQDRLKREFLLDTPQKIVIDFAASRAFPSKKERLQTPLFREIAIGAHKNYYRIAIMLDGSCLNHLYKSGDLIWIECR